MKQTITIIERNYTEHTYTKREAARISIQNGYLLIFDKNGEYVESIPAEYCDIYIG